MKESRTMEIIAGILNVLGAIAIMIILTVTVADVIMNKIFNSPFPGATEIITSAMPISVFAYLVSAQVKKRHITIDVIVGRLKAQWQTLLRFVAQGIGIYLFGLLTYLNIPMALHSFRIGEHTGGNVAVPIYPAKIVIPVATGLLTIQLIVELCKGIHSFFASSGADAADSNRNGIRP